MNDLRLLNESFNRYYKNGIKFLENKDYSNAKRNINLAAITLLKLAKESEGDLKKYRVKRAEELTDLAERIHNKAIEAKTTKRNTANDDLSRVTGNAKKATNHKGGDTSFMPIQTKPNITFDDVVGLQSAKDEIRTKVIDPMNHPEVYKMFKKKSGGGIMLYGVPGTGKTMLAKAIANELDAAFYSVKCSDIMSKWVGESENRIRDLFQEARKNKLSILFFDEFEAIGTKRDSYSTVMKRVVPELLAQMQGFEESENTMLIIAATNRPWDIDSAFLRPGRFDTHIYVPLPDDEARKAIIQKKLEGIELSDDFSLEYAVTETNGFNASDVADNYAEKLKNQAIERTIKSGVVSPITQADSEKTLESVKSSVSVKDLEKIKEYENTIYNK